MQPSRMCSTHALHWKWSTWSLPPLPFPSPLTRQGPAAEALVPVVVSELQQSQQRLHADLAAALEEAQARKVDNAKLRCVGVGVGGQCRVGG